MCHSHIKRHLKSHSKPVAEEKKTTCFLSPKTVYNKERKLKNKMFRAAKRHLLSHCSSFWTNRGSFSQDIATTGSSLVYLWFFYTLSVFLCFSVPTCTPHFSRAIHRLLVSCWRKKKNVVQRFAYLFRLTCWMLLQTPSPPLKHSAKKLSLSS